MSRPNRTPLEKPTIPLTEKREMQVVGNGRHGTTAGGPFIKFLEANKARAAIIGAVIDGIRDSLAQAYPGETRTNRIPNAEWRKSGFESIARSNELMNRGGS